MATLHMKSTDLTTIAGLRGTGKTTLSNYLAKLCGDNVLIYDPMNQYTSFKPELRYIPKSDSMSEFDAVCRRVIARGNMVFFIEEAERYLGQGKLLGPDSYNLINRGRNWGIGVVAVTRRIQRLSKDYFDLCDNIIFFRCGTQSLKIRGYLEEMIGSSICGQIRQLREHHFLFYNIETETAVERWLEFAGETAHLKEGKEKATMPVEKETTSKRRGSA